MSDILVISSELDPHIDLVQAHLDNEVWVYDPSKFPNENDITYRFNGQGSKTEIESNGRNFTGVNSIWFRKPPYVEPEEMPVDEEYLEYTMDAYNFGVRGLYDLLNDKFWMSDYRAIMRGNNKMLQLQEASRVGFVVPPTVVTSNPQDAINFRREYGSVIAKSLAFSPILVNGETRAFYTTRIAPEDDVDFSGLAVAPTIFQTEIKQKKDIRVTIVGDQVFPCITTATGEFEDNVDWRSGLLTDQVLYTPCNIPLNLEEKCITYVKDFGLSFGVVEFALDTDGVYWFLEINPNGQWAFIEDETGVKISKAIANSLQRGY